MLPSLDFSEWFVKNNEIFLKTSNEVKRVVSQGIPSSILVKLPGGLTDVIICFPTPSFVRVYVSNTWIKEHRITKENRFIGEYGDGNRFYHLSKRVKYRYGIELCPWMYHGYLKTDMSEIRSRIVNYVIENCAVGFSGIQLKFKDESEPVERDKEWFKVFWFDGGNEYHFFHEKHTQILELFPIKKESRLFWEPKDGWKQFKKIKSMPGKIQ